MKTRAFGLIIGLLASGALSAAESGSATESDSATESGAQLDWSLNTALARTDNATLVDTAPISDTIASAGGTIDFSRKGSRINAAVRAAGSYFTYFDDTYDDDFLGSGDATFRLGLIGDALTWTIDDTFGQTTTNAFGPSTPDNRGHVNVMSTGPDLRLTVSSTTELVILGRYENATYEDLSSIDSHGWTGRAAVVRRASPAVAWSFNVGASHVVYDTADSTSQDKQEVFVRLEAGGARQTIEADLGVAFLDQRNETDQTPLIRVKWTRSLTTSWSLALDAASEYLNSSDQFAGGVADGTELGGTQDVILTDQAHRNDSAGMSLSFERPRTTFRIFGGGSRERFPSAAALDRNTWSVGASASRQMTRRLLASIETGYEYRDFGGSDGEDKTTSITAGLDWRLGKAIFLGIAGNVQRRSGDTDFSYDETVYQASLSYRPAGR